MEAHSSEMDDLDISPSGNNVGQNICLIIDSRYLWWEMLCYISASGQKSTNLIEKVYTVNYLNQQQSI